jgi:glutamate--cysteine ligase
MESLATLRDIILTGGYQVRIASLRPDLKTAETVELPSGRSVRLEPLIRRDRRVGVADYDACLVILNNDLMSGIPEQLRDIEQHMVPPPGLGWSNRLKSGHFRHYNNVANEFARLLGIDPWLINPLFRNCGELDFKKREGEDCLVRNVEALLDSVQKKYNEYGIDKPPFVIIKADAGTYGMGIISVSSTDEVRSLNRKQRTKMAAMKGGTSVSKVILQEGVYTFETWGQQEAVAEPVVYMIDHFVVGGFYRVHTERGVNENLNAPGMHFQPLAFVEPCNTPDRSREPDAEPNRFYAYGVLGRLALLAAARELAEHNAQ